MTEKNKLEVFNSIQFDDDLTLEEQGKGRHFVSRFIEAGIAEYKGTFGKVLITKETLDRFIKTIVGAPVIIKHKDITAENVDKERVGVVSEVWYNEQDGWFYCSGIIFDRQAIDLIKNQGWSVSCTYDFESDNQKGIYHGLEYDREFTDGNFLHLALVPNPRYERANIVINSKAENEDKWITIKPNGEDGKGRHLLLKDGESPKEAIERTYGKKEDKKEQPNDVTKDEHADIKEMLKKVRPDLHFNYNKNSKNPYEIKYRDSKRFNLDDIATSSDKKEDIYEYLRQQTKQGSDIEKELTAKINEAKESKTTDAKVPKKYNYTLTKKEVDGDKWLGGMADTGSWYTNGSFAIDKNYLNIKGQPTKSMPDLDRGVKQIMGAEKEKVQKGYQKLTDYEIGELDSRKGKVVKYSYHDEKNGFDRDIFINKKFHDIFKNFDLKFRSPIDPIYAYDNGKLIGSVMPIQVRPDNKFTKVQNEIEEDSEDNEEQLKLFDKQSKASNALLNGLNSLLDDYKPVKEDLPILEGLKGILGE